MTDRDRTAEALTPVWWLRMAPVGALLAAAVLHLVVPRADWLDGWGVLTWTGLALAATALATGLAIALLGSRLSRPQKAGLQAMVAVAGVLGVSLLAGYWLALALLPPAMAAFVRSCAAGKE